MPLKTLPSWATVLKTGNEYTTYGVELQQHLEYKFPLLALPRELRDKIYSYALPDEWHWDYYSSPEMKDDILCHVTGEK
ncbi:hypothetical protein BU16DRAFT_563935 [Lophium mytilinum]|uniref:Uncharacterized protein n=1 Tax=Lophium mytilinum TaxID=390894 RepID=A0A6A6QNY9_9PEZI|nr:hypothetical protein BU16DRAFT_563935 [Lophium mytilinum]